MKRYDIYPAIYEIGQIEIDEDVDGEWVKYEDISSIKPVDEITKSDIARASVKLPEADKKLTIQQFIEKYFNESK